ncbi:MAG: GMC family oxidoreductase [Actinomycetota bacterium]
MQVHPKVDVVTMGAGWTANILAWKLTAAGLQVVSIDQGPARFGYPEFSHDHDSIGYAVRKKMMIDITKETWTWRPQPTASALPMRQYGSFHPGRGVGGSAAHWSGMLWRFLPTDFRYRTHTIERYGEDKLPEGSRIRDWPVTYAELEPYYDRFEYDIGASGKAGNVRGNIIPGGNVFEGPRERDYPTPPLVTTVAADMFGTAAEELGYHPFVQPSGILSEAYRDRFGNIRSGCLYCGFCTRFGCEVDAKATGITTHAPAALKTGRYEIRADSHVIGVELADNGLATGLRYVDCDGVEHFQPADIVLLTGYTLGNVKTMLTSRGPKHPDGIGNNRGLVGTNYTYQLWETPVTGLFKDRDLHLYMGNTSTIKVIYDFNADNFDHSDVPFVGGASLFGGSGERQPITTVGDVPLTASAGSWGAEYARQFVEGWDSFTDVTMQGESLPYDDQFMDLDPHYKDAWGNPLLRLTFDWHENDQKLYHFVAGKAKEIMDKMGPDLVSYTPVLAPYRIDVYQSTHITGGAIMGSDPGDSVTNSYGQVWDTPNVFVTGAALYPQNPGANPTGTLCALAYRTGDALTERYLKAPGTLL